MIVAAGRRVRRRRTELTRSGVEGELIQAVVYASYVKGIIPESSGSEYRPPGIQTLDYVVAAGVEMTHIVAIDEEENALFAPTDE